MDHPPKPRFSKDGLYQAFTRSAQRSRRPPPPSRRQAARRKLGRGAADLRLHALRAGIAQGHPHRLQPGHPADQRPGTAAQPGAPALPRYPLLPQRGAGRLQPRDHQHDGGHRRVSEWRRQYLHPRRGQLFLYGKPDGVLPAAGRREVRAPDDDALQPQPAGAADEFRLVGGAGADGHGARDERRQECPQRLRTDANRCSGIRRIP